MAPPSFIPYVKAIPICGIVPLDCSVCDTYVTSECTNPINIPANLNPSQIIYLWVTDKFKKTYQDYLKAKADGSIDIDPTKYPDFWHKCSGSLDLFMTSDITGLN